MVVAARLKTAGARLAALLAAVLLVHAIVLQWLSHQLQAAPILRAMAPPMFTRVLEQSAAAPPPPSVATVMAAAPKPRHVIARAIARAPAASAAASRARPAPAAEPEIVAKAPEPPPVAAASSAPPPASSAAAQAVAAVAASAPASAVAQAAASAASSPASASATSVPMGADGWPADTRLSYRLGGQYRSGELHGSARVQWLRQGEKYETRVDISVTLLASLVLTSQGEVTAQSLYPRAYEEVRGSGPRNARLGEEAITLHDGRRVPRPAGVQDTASQFVELSHRFASGQDKLEVGSSVSLWLARPGGVDLWVYDVVARESLRTPQLGIVEAFHLKPRPIANPRGNITAEMWFAPSLQYLPVRIKVTMGEDTFVDLLVDRIEQR